MVARRVTTTEEARNGRWLSLLVRPLVSAALLAILFTSAGLSDFLALARGASPLWLAVGLLLVVLALVISAYKWQWLLTTQRVPVPMSRLFTTYLVGLFFNNFLPTNIGGDVVRIHDIAKYSGKPAEAAASVIGERLLAAVALGITAAIGLALSYQVSGGFTGIVLGVLVLSSAIVGLFANERARRIVGRGIKLPDTFSLRSRTSRVASSMSTSFRNKTVVGWVILLSLGFHTIVVLLSYVIFLALGVEVSLVYCFLFIPIIMALQMVPISVNGLGVREGAYVYFFGWAGLSAAQAMAASLLFWALVTVVSLAGGVIFALRR